MESAYATLLAINSKFGFYLAPFLKYGDILAENCVFFILLSYLAPPLHMFRLEFRGEVKPQETIVMGLVCGEGCMILSSTVFD